MVSVPSRRSFRWSILLFPNLKKLSAGEHEVILTPGEETNARVQIGRFQVATRHVVRDQDAGWISTPKGQAQLSKHNQLYL